MLHYSYIYTYITHVQVIKTIFNAYLMELKFTSSLRDKMIVMLNYP